MKGLVLMRAAWVVCALAAAVLLASFGVEANYASRSKLIQRVKPSAESELFGDTGELIGSPQLLIIEDPSVFLPDKTLAGVYLVDENKLVEKKIYPLQLQTVQFVAGMARMGLGAVAVIACIGGLVLKKRIQKKRAIN